MPIYQLSHELVFPHPSLAEEDGLLAIGGDLSVDRILLAYHNGIFPWYNEGEPIIWHAPKPRFVLFPEDLKVSKSMKQLIKSDKYKVTLDHDFKQVIHKCGAIKRADQDDTWITNEMEKAYIELHHQNYAHSVEVWNKNNELVGGLYGINLGTVFYGESMFHEESNTSKLAFISLIQNFNFHIIDCQVYTKHLASLGAKEINSEDFYEIIVKESEKVNLLNRKINFVSKTLKQNNL